MQSNAKQWKPWLLQSHIQQRNMTGTLSRMHFLKSSDSSRWIKVYVISFAEFHHIMYNTPMSFIPGKFSCDRKTKIKKNISPNLCAKDVIQNLNNISERIAFRCISQQLIYFLNNHITQSSLATGSRENDSRRNRRHWNVLLHPRNTFGRNNTAKLNEV